MANHKPAAKNHPWKRKLKFFEPFEAMEALRNDGWCVVLKCMPKELGWMVEGSRSEFDAPCPDSFIGLGKWCAEANDMSHATQVHKNRPYRHDCFGMGETATEAVQKLWDAISRADAKSK